MSVRKDEPAVPSTAVLAPVEDPADAKVELQRRMDEARQSISETVGDIKDTVEGQFATAKETISGLLDWRDGFQQDPIVWSVGSLSAGFALGYTLGYAKRTGALGKQHSGLAAFADTLVHELAALRTHLPMAALDPTFKRVLGFDLSQLFEEMSGAAPRRAKKPTPRIRAGGVAARKRRASPTSNSRGATRKKKRRAP